MTIENIDRLKQLGFIALEEAPHDLFWLFTYSSGEVELRLSWSLADKSMQTTLRYKGELLSTVCSEGLTESHVTDEKVVATFEDEEMRTTLEVALYPRLCVTWGTLRMR